MVMSDGDYPDSRPCPSRAELGAFVRGELSDADGSAVAAHLSSCPACSGTVRELDHSDPSDARNFWDHVAGSDAGLIPEYSVPDSPFEAGGCPTGDPRRPPAPDDPPPPERLGQYRVAGRLGRGGMGVVYKAQHLRLKKWVAVKVLPPHRVTDRHTVARFEREMEVVGRLDHPNIVRATDAGEADGFHFLVMELVLGIDLGRLVRRVGPVAVPDACELTRQAAVGLQHAHESGLVHRDVKPNNLMLSKTGEVKLLDLGLALLRGEHGTGALTADGAVMGTADYMAPEQWEACHEVDIRADLYSLGCTLYTLLVGRPPFGYADYDSILRKMAAHAHTPVPPVAGFRSDVPPGLVAVLDTLLAKDAAGRPATPSAVALALAPFCSGADLPALARRTATARHDPDVPGPPDRTTSPWDTPPISTNPDRPPSTASSPQPLAAVPPRRRVRRWAGAATALGGVLVIGLAASKWPRPPDEEPAPRDTQPVSLTPPADPSPPEAKTGGWQRLLTQRPAERVWLPSLYSHLEYDPKVELLRVETSSHALIRLGETSARGFKLEIGFRQVRWIGGVGIFFGGQPATGPGNYRAQVIHLARSEPTATQSFNLIRSTGNAWLPAATDPPLGINQIATTVLARPQEPQEQLLEVTVSRGRLTRIRWNAEPCRELVSDKANERFEEKHYQGEFGIYCGGSASTITTARFMPTE
jgi:serine/threonine protein kinase